MCNCQASLKHFVCVRRLKFVIFTLHYITLAVRQRGKRQLRDQYPTHRIPRRLSFILWWRRHLLR